MYCICPQVLACLQFSTQNTWECLIEYSPIFWNQQRKMQRIQNYFILGTQLLGLAFPDRDLSWIGFLELGGNLQRKREMGWIVFGVLGHLCKNTWLHFRFWHGSPDHSAPNIRSDGVWQASLRLFYGKFCDRTSSDVSHHSIDGISEGVDGTSQRSCAQIKTKAYWGMWHHIGQWQLLHSIPNMPKYHGGFAKCQFVNGC